MIETNYKLTSLGTALLWEGSSEEIYELEEVELVIIVSAVELVEDGEDLLVVHLLAHSGEEEHCLSNGDLTVVVAIDSEEDGGDVLIGHAALLERVGRILWVNSATIDLAEFINSAIGALGLNFP